MTQVFGKDKQDAEEERAHGQWAALVREVKALAKAAGVTLYIEKKRGTGFRAVDGAESLSVNKGRSYEGGGPWASLVTWGRRYNVEYRVEIEGLERWRGGAAYRRNSRTHGPMLYHEIVTLGAKRREALAAEVVHAEKMSKTHAREAKQAKFDTALLGPDSSGPGHSARIETGTSGYRVTSTFTLMVDEQASPEVRNEFDIWSRSEKVAGNPYPEGKGA